MDERDDEPANKRHHGHAKEQSTVALNLNPEHSQVAEAFVGTHEAWESGGARMLWC